MLIGSETKKWLARVLSLPRVRGPDLAAMFVLLFVGVPLLCDAVLILIDEPARIQTVGFWIRIFLFSGSFGSASALLERALKKPNRAPRRPDARRVVAVLASEKLPADLSLLSQGDRAARFAEFQKLKHWLGGVIRIIEWHQPRIERLYVFCTNDAWSEDQRNQLQRLLDGYLKLVGEKKEVMPFVECRPVGESLDYEFLRLEVVRLQKHLLADGFEEKSVIFDFTGSTKPMGVGMVMACLDDRYDLEYLPQIFSDPGPNATPYQKLGWGLLPFQEGDPDAVPGLLPILIDTDANVIMESVQS